MSDDNTIVMHKLGVQRVDVPPQVTPKQYSHRNGERTPPTEAGYYWFKGVIMRYGDPQDIAGLKIVEFYNGTGIIANEESDDFLHDTEGQWWGPITGPWDEVQP